MTQCEYRYERTWCFVVSEKKTSPLVRRTVLTFISNLLGQGAKFILSFVLGPIIINGLGKELYGIWGMIGQVAGYFSLTDLRPAGTMKFLLSIKQHSLDIDEKKRLIGTTLFLWVASVPFVALTGYLVILFFPRLVNVITYTEAIQVVLIISISGVVVDRLLAIPSNVLRAQNLEYKGMGISAIMVLFNGFISAFAVLQGWGIIGLAWAAFLGIVISNAVRIGVARRAIPWIGVKWPIKDETKIFVKTSVWLTFSAISHLLLTSTDVLLIGLFLEPAASSIYLTTSLVLRSLTEPLSTFFSSANAGIAGLCGSGEWQRVETLRREMYMLAIGFMTILGTGVISLNRAFLELWVGSDFFGGQLLNILLVIGFLLVVLVRIDTPIVSAALLIKEQAWVIFLGGVLSVLIGILTMPQIGVSGMALGIIAGQGILFIFNWNLLRKRLVMHTVDYVRDIGRSLMIGVLLLTAAEIISSFIIPSTWLEFILWSGMVGIVAAIVVWFASFSRQARQTVSDRFTSSIKRFLPSMTMQKYNEK